MALLSLIACTGNPDVAGLQASKAGALRVKGHVGIVWDELGSVENHHTHSAYVWNVRGLVRRLQGGVP